MRRAIIAAAIVATGLAITPAAVAYSEEDSVSTGESDSHGGALVNLKKPCPDVIRTWEITLTLEDPAPTDAVSLTAQGQVSTQGNVATGTNPTATVTVTNNHGCQPPVQVTGLLVDGSVDYTLTY
jgi:hypothetical protein